MEGLKDIKEVVEVQEHSLLLLLSLILGTLLLLSVAVYLFKNRRRRRKKATPKEVALAKLKALDYTNAKEVVYGFEEHGTLFLTEKNKAQFNSIVKEFDIYKYRRDVPELANKLKNRINTFIKELKWQILPLNTRGYSYYLSSFLFVVGGVNPKELPSIFPIWHCLKKPLKRVNGLVTL